MSEADRSNIIGPKILEQESSTAKVLDLYRKFFTNLKNEKHEFGLIIWQFRPGRLTGSYTNNGLYTVYNPGAFTNPASRKTQHF